MKKQVIITGGTGYLGGSVAEHLKRAGYAPVLVDNFSTSRRPSACPFPIHEVNLADITATRKAWEAIGPAEAVIHFAALALVPESCREPERYLRNNLLATLNAAEASLECGISRFVHSSSCSVYGIPEKVPIVESHPLKPISPYGETKLLSERILRELSQYRGLKVLNLRYFNPGGALDGAGHGESHSPETHLIPNVVRGALAGRPIPVHGRTHPTKDGTCIRDFIHVEDLAEAHLLALRLLGTTEKGWPEAINLGAGRGASVMEVIRAAERVFAKKLELNLLPPREGDPPVLVADTSLARKTLGWAPRRSLDDILLSHGDWERSHGK